MGGNIPTVFGLVTIIFVVCYFITITTFREIPLALIEKDEMLRPLSNAAIKKELKKCNSNVFYIDQVRILKLMALLDIRRERMRLLIGNLTTFLLNFFF